MVEFVKDYPAVIISITSLLTAIILGVVGWAITSTLTPIRESLKALMEDIKDHEKRLSTLEGEHKAIHLGGINRSD